MFDAFAGHCGVGIDYIDQVYSAGITYKKIPYLIDREVRIVKANVKINDYGFHLKIK